MIAFYHAWRKAHLSLAHLNFPVPKLHVFPSVQRLTILPSPGAQNVMTEANRPGLRQESARHCFRPYLHPF